MQGHFTPRVHRLTAPLLSHITQHTKATRNSSHAYWCYLVANTCSGSSSLYHTTAIMPSNPQNPMTRADAARIQSHTAKQNDGKVPAGSFAARAQVGARGHDTCVQVFMFI